MLTHPTPPCNVITKNLINISLDSTNYYFMGGVSTCLKNLPANSFQLKM